MATTLSAVADKGYKFSGWYDDSGDKLSSSDEYTFTAESNIEITAKFSKKTTGGSGDRGGGGGSFGGSGNSGGSTSSKKPTKEEPEEKKKDDSAKPATYSDVKTNDWFYDSVKYVSENGIMNGITEKEFAPNNNLTRAMFVTVLYRIEGSPETGMSPFGDVGSGSWYEKAVSWATENNIVNGVSETEFAPNNNITREQMAAILYRYATYKGKDVTLKGNANTLSFDDTEEISGYAISALQWAVENGLMSGESPSTINPKNNSTRAQAATVFMRMLTN